MAGEFDINLSNGNLLPDNVLATLYPLEVNGPDNRSTPRLIQDIQTSPDAFVLNGDLTYRFVAGFTFDVNRTFSVSIATVDTTVEEFTVSGDYTFLFTGGQEFTVFDSTGNDGTYTVVAGGSTYDGNTNLTTIPVTGDITDTTADGNIRSTITDNYTVDTGGSTYDEPSNQTTIPISGSLASTALPYGEIVYTITDDRSTLKLPGKGTINYGELLVEDLVRMVEHFASDVSPDNNPVITGSGPAAQALTGQLWYNTSDDTFYRWDGSQWTNNVNVGTSSVTLTDAEDGDKVIHLTGTEGTLPSPWSGSDNYNIVGVDDTTNEFTISGDSTSQFIGGFLFVVSGSTGNDGTYTVAAGGSTYDGGNNETTIPVNENVADATADGQIIIGEFPGAVLWPESNPPDGEPLFRVLSTDATERLRIEHHDTANSGYTRSANNLDVQSTGESYFHGQLGIGGTGLPTIDRTLTVEGTGIAVNSPSTVDANITLDAPTGQASTLVFETQDVTRGEITVDHSVTGTPLQLNPTSGNNVELVQGGGAVQSYGRVGINNVPPTGNVWLEVTGDIQANSQFRGSDQAVSNPTYSFANDLDTGMFLSSVGVLSLAAGGTEIAQVNASSGTLKVVGSAPSADNDVPSKKYVDDLVGSSSWREPVRVRDQLTRTDQSNFPTTGMIDGISLNDGDRVLFDEVTTVADRDIWIWDATGSTWHRDYFFDVQTRTVGDVVYVQQGTDSGTVWAFNSNSDWDLIIARETGGANVLYETQTASSDSQQVFTLNNNYKQGGNNLLVFVNGQKRTLGEFYNETGANEITVIAPSPVQTGDRFDFYIIEPTTIKASNFQRETQTGLTGTPTITFSTITYVKGTENLLVFINGQKAVRETNYEEISSTKINWLTPSLTTSDNLEFYSSVPVTAGTRLEDIADVQSTPLPTDGQFLQYNQSAGRWEYVTNTASLILDLNDDGANESTTLNEIATVNDTNSIFTMPVADKLLIDVGVNWPQSDDTLAIGGNAVAVGTTPSDGDVLTWNGTSTEWEPQAPSGGGVSSSTGTSTDNTLARYDGTTGDTIQQSGVTIDDNDNVSGAGQTISFETADFTLAAIQAGQVLDCSKGTAFTVTVPDNATVPLPVGYTVQLVQSGAGTVSVSPAAGVTVQSISTLNLNGQWAGASLYKRLTDEWVLIGDLA